jgi:hypothetical protein
MRAILRYLLFAASVAVLVAALKAANWLPTVIEKGLVRPYASLDEMQHALNVRNILIPSYFPEHLVWPPAYILAQTKPHYALTMEFVDRKSSATALVIAQSAGAPIEVNRRLQITEVREAQSFDLRGRSAALQVGVCAGGETCSRLTWQEGPLRIEAAMRSTPPDLLRIADSLIR